MNWKAIVIQIGAKLALKLIGRLHEWAESHIKEDKPNWPYPKD